MTCTDRKTTNALTAETAHTVPTVVPESPARSSASRTRPTWSGRGATWRGDVNDSQISTSPTPTPRPATAPTSPSAGQDRVHVDPVAGVPLRVRRHPAGPGQPVAVADEQRRGLDHVALHPARHGDDLLDPAYAVVPDAEMDHEVDRRGHGGDHEPGGDVLPRQSCKGGVQPRL